jgi:predicted dehydrogenase
VAVIGAGDRGRVYARLARELGATVTAVANPGAARREAFAAEFGLPPARQFPGWQALLAEPRLADAVVIATPDHLHVEPAVAAAERGYHILLEKPLAPDVAAAARVAAAAERAGVVTALCHVLRYNAYTAQLKALLDGGAIGRLAAVDHVTPIGWWHFAHSFVRGNWRATAESSPLLLSMAVHDLDWLSYVVARPVERVASFGSLREFRPAHRPAGAADRCLDCGVADDCPYAATRLYRGFLAEPVYGDWPLKVVTADVSAAGLERALREGPYGECVYLGRNDVVDHQVVALEAADGVTVAFTITAFTPMANRRTRLFGSRGQLEGDGSAVTLTDFTTGTRTVFDTAGDQDGDHPDADRALVAAFLGAVATGDRSRILSDARSALATQRLIDAAERARLTGATVAL